MKNKLSIIIPVYNEEETIVKTIFDILNFDFLPNQYEIIVVNDGSTDRTKLILDQFNADKRIKLIHHKLNKGYGAALKSGIHESSAECLAMIDADGQHKIEDVLKLYDKLIEKEADLVIGNRGQHDEQSYRKVGKWIIRWIAGILLPMEINDLNSGMKICQTNLAKKYTSICPDSFAFSDTFTLIFLSQRHLVLEYPITIAKRQGGQSKINTQTAFLTVNEILNIVILFNPMRIFLPLTLIFIVAGVGWALPFLIRGSGVSMLSAVLILAGIVFFALGLIAEQLSQLRKNQIN